MYVRAVDYGKKKRVMILFYPLGSLEATWADRTKDILRPVVKTLDTLEKGSTPPVLREQLPRILPKRVSAIFFDNFSCPSSLFGRSEKRSEYGDGPKWKIFLNGQYRLASEFKMLLKSDEEVVAQSLKAFSRFKTSLINIIGMREKLEENYRQSMYAVQNFFKENDKILNGFETVLGNINKNREIFQSLVDIGSRLKQADGPEELAKTIQLLNITLSKASMLLEDDRTPELSRVVSQIRQVGDFFRREWRIWTGWGKSLAGRMI